MTVSVLSNDILSCVACHRDEPEAVEEIPSLPGQARYGVNRIVEALKPVVQDGLQSVLLFGVPSKLTKVYLPHNFQRINAFKNY